MPSEDSNTTENGIGGEMPEDVSQKNGLIIRPTGHEADVHFENVWESEFNEKKVGVRSQKKYAFIFQDKLDWERSHHRWESDRVQDTDMWEIDLEAVFYVVCGFTDEGADVTVDKEVWRAFVNDLD